MKFKKIVTGVIAVIMTAAMLAPMTAFAAAQDQVDSEPAFTEVPLAGDVSTEVNYVEGVKNSNGEMASGLISSYTLKLERSSNGRVGYVYATTNCIPEVTKCGFTEIRLQRRANASANWQDYATYLDEYTNTFSCSRSFSVSVTTGYQYRLYAVHYGYRNIFSTQKITNWTNAIQF